MKAFVKGTSTLLLALILLLGILFLPSDQFDQIKDSLDFISRSDNAAIEFGYYLAKRTANAAVILGLTLLITVAAKRAYQNRSR